jgi:hypothetical protein
LLIGLPSLPPPSKALPEAVRPELVLVEAAVTKLTAVVPMVLPTRSDTSTTRMRSLSLWSILVGLLLVPREDEEVVSSRTGEGEGVHQEVVQDSEADEVVSRLEVPVAGPMEGLNVADGVLTGDEEGADTVVGTR